MLASEEVSSGSLVQSVGCVDAVPAQVVEGICTRRHSDSGNSVGDVPSTEVVLVEVVFATLSTACRQWLCHICSFQYRAIEQDSVFLLSLIPFLRAYVG